VRLANEPIEEKAFVVGIFSNTIRNTWKKNLILLKKTTFACPSHPLASHSSIHHSKTMELLNNFTIPFSNHSKEAKLFYKREQMARNRLCSITRFIVTL
jgi:hypothetical protein